MMEDGTGPGQPPPIKSTFASPRYPQNDRRESSQPRHSPLSHSLSLSLSLDPQIHSTLPPPSLLPPSLRDRVTPLQHTIPHPQINSTQPSSPHRRCLPSPTTSKSETSSWCNQTLAPPRPPRAIDYTYPNAKWSPVSGFSTARAQNVATAESAHHARGNRSVRCDAGGEAEGGRGRADRSSLAGRWR
jgi:hypothetical protein